MPKANGGWTMLAHEFVDVHLPSLTPAASVLAVYVARHTIGKGNSATSRRLADIVAGTGLCERTIRRCVPELSKVIAVHQEPGKVPMWQFLITPPEKMSGVPPTKMSATPDKNVLDPGQNCRGYIRKKDPSKDPPKEIRSSGDEQASNGYSPAYLDWYETYPHKVGKFDGFKAYRRQVKTVADRELLGRNSPPWNEHFRSRQQKFIPRPGSFLNSRDWEEPPPVGIQNSGAQEVLEAMTNA